MLNQIAFYEAKLNYETDSWDLFAALQNNDNVVVIDTRSVTANQAEHIPGALSFPHATMSELTTAHLNKDSIYVTYCDGIGCNGSTKGALKLSQLGFTVRELLGGLDWWKRDGYATDGKEGKPGKRVTDK